MRKNNHLRVACLWVLLAGALLLPESPAAQEAAAPAERRAFSERDWQRLHEELDYSEAPRSQKQRPPADRGKREKAAPAASSLPQVILLGLVIAALSWFLWQTYGKAGRRLRAAAGDSDDDDEELNAVAHNLLETELDPLLAQAEARGAWHLATRLRFLALLQAMHVGGRIRWQKNKTNRDYMLEAYAWVGAAEFRRLTLAYERIWYGLHYPDEAAYRALAADFSTLAAAARAAHAPA